MGGGVRGAEGWDTASFPKVTFEKTPTGHLLPICSHTTPNHAETRQIIRHDRASPNLWNVSAVLPHRLRDQRVAVLWPLLAHNPKVAAQRGSSGHAGPIPSFPKNHPGD